MYEELIKRLREYATEDQWVQTRIGDTFVEAADAIEELNRENKEIMFRANQLEAMNDSLIKDDEEQAKDVGYWAGRRDYEPKWIPVTERLPECEWGTEVGNIEWISCGMVFAGCFGRGGSYRDAYFRTWTDGTEGIDAKDADYWRSIQISEPPKEET